MTLLLLLLVAGPTTNEGAALRTVVGSLRKSHSVQKIHQRFVWIPDGSEETKAVLDYAMNIAIGYDEIVIGNWINDTVVGYNLRAFDHKRIDEIHRVWDSLALVDPVFHVPADSPLIPPHLNYCEGDVRYDVLASELSGSPAPILEAHFLIEQLLDFKYYEFRGIKVGSSIKEHLKLRGYGDIPYLADYQNISGVTGEQRIIAAYQGTKTSVAATITYDVFDESSGLIRNLDTFAEVSDGSELFIPLPNGLIEFVLSDGDGKIVAEAPFNLAVDTSKPKGHDTRLRAAISCISCHAQDEGLYRSIQNDFSKLPQPGFGYPEVKALRDLYSEDLDRVDGVLGRARREYQLACSEIGEDLATKAAALIHKYRYEPVDKTQAEKELGHSIDIPLELITDPEVALIVQDYPLSRKSWNSIRSQVSALHYSLQDLSRLKLALPKAIPLESHKK